MLTELRIRNVAIIASVNLPLRAGFNVLSGETGAGKSIIVGALGLLFGERGSADLVRPGADRASVEGVFDASALPAVMRALDERGIEIEEGVIVFRREISSAGRSRAWINGTPVTSAVLGELGAQLVDVHGQHESRGLLDDSAQQQILDAFAGATEHASAVARTYDQLQQVLSDIESLHKRRSAAERRADYLRHLVTEIDAASLKTGEDVSLEEEARRLAHVVDLRQHAAHLQEAIDDEEVGALRQLSAAQRALGAAAKLDPSLDRLRELLDGATVQLQEIRREISAYEEALESDPGRLADVERRRDLIFRVTRKYGGSVESALQQLAEASAELELVDTAAGEIGALTQKETKLRAQLLEECRQLTKARAQGSKRLQGEVDAILPELGMPGGRFVVVLAPTVAADRNGAERVEFQVALNVGHEARPLTRVASGGELARVMLALKTILARLDATPTLVFDEVDSGIGGRVALAVGDTIRTVAQHHQVFVITHLPQIASRAHHHIVVHKAAPGGVTTADIAIVDGETRVQEIARMLGGDPESETSRAHARELLGAPATSKRKR